MTQLLIKANGEKWTYQFCNKNDAFEYRVESSHKIYIKIIKELMDLFEKKS